VTYGELDIVVGKGYVSPKDFIDRRRSGGVFLTRLLSQPGDAVGQTLHLVFEDRVAHVADG
jgi:hypothetical protein